MTLLDHRFLTWDPPNTRDPGCPETGGLWTEHTAECYLEVQFVRGSNTTPFHHHLSNLTQLLFYLVYDLSMFMHILVRLAGSFVPFWSKNRRLWKRFWRSRRPKRSKLPKAKPTVNLRLRMLHCHFDSRPFVFTKTICLLQL